MLWNPSRWLWAGQGVVGKYVLILPPPLVSRELRSWIFWGYHCQKLSHSTSTLTMCWGRLPNQCMRYECCALMASPASHCGMSPGPLPWQECSMHRLHGGVMLTWATKCACTISCSNYGGWDFCRPMLLRSRKCVKPLMTDSSHQSSIMGTMY